MLRKILPKNIKILLNISWRNARDIYAGQYFSLSKGVEAASDLGEWRECARVEQPIHPTASSSQKIHNLRIAIARIERRLVQPGEIGSFWHWVGEPSARRGYQAGRSLAGDGIAQEVGGGLCQLSGILFHAALLAGLSITERHAHSIDIYQEHERHTPLGADATVVYGYKDFRFVNNTGAALFFTFQLNERQLICQLWSAQPGAACQLTFEREEMAERRIARLRRILPDGTEEVFTSWYRLMLTAR